MNSEQVQVQTATVSVKVLTIGERQMTAGVIRSRCAPCAVSREYDPVGAVEIATARAQPRQQGRRSAPRDFACRQSVDTSSEVCT